MRSVQILPIDKVRPDPNQPRKVFNVSHIKGLAENLKIEGIINPIEVDKNFVIITGECRLRAAKEAEWVEVPVIINAGKLSKYERFRRQMAENLHQSAAGGSAPMNAIDVAKGYKKMLKMMGYNFSAGEKWQGMDQGMSKLAKELGVSQQTIAEYLNLLAQPKYVLQDIEKGTPRTLYSSIDRVPEKYQKELKQAVSDKKITSRADIRRFARLAKTKPEKAEIEMLRLTQKQSEGANRVLNRAVELSLALKKASPNEFSLEDRKMVFLQLGSVSGAIRNFLGRLNEQKELEESSGEKK